MKTLILLALLLLAGEAGAGEPTSWRYMTCRSDPLRQCRVINNVIEDPPKDVVCLAQMEAAMRAMEPYLFPPPPPTAETTEVKYPCLSRCQHLKALKALDEREKVDEQWTAAKTCWMTP